MQEARVAGTIPTKEGSTEYKPGDFLVFNDPDKEDGYAMPAEWLPHAGTWISWPHNPQTWPGRLESAEAAMAAAVAALSPGETVHVNGGMLMD